MQITRKQLSEWKPCCQEPGERYCAKNLDVLFKGKDSISWQDILELKDVPPADKIWLAVRPGALLPQIQQRLINAIMDRAVEKYHFDLEEIDDFVSHIVHAAIDVSRSWSVDVANAAFAVAFYVVFAAIDAGSAISGDAEREFQLTDLEKLIAEYAFEDRSE